MNKQSFSYICYSEQVCTGNLLNLCFFFFSRKQFIALFSFYSKFYLKFPEYVGW